MKLAKVPLVYCFVGDFLIANILEISNDVKFWNKVTPENIPEMTHLCKIGHAIPIP